MRTTVTLDPDTEALVKAEMRKGDLSFKQALNDAIRKGLQRHTPRRFKQRTFDLGVRPGVDYDKALALAADLEDEEILRKLAQGR